MEDVKTFSTRDLGVAAALVTHGFQVAGLDLQFEGARRLPIGYFLFEDTPDARQVEQDFLYGSCTGDLRAFMGATRSLKSMVVGRDRAPR